MLADVLLKLASNGKTCFSFGEILATTDSSVVALKSALRRLANKGDIAMPYRGFYVIIPPAFRAIGCLPAEQFIPELMSYLGHNYYAGLLSAAEYYGATHHHPQTFQVVVNSPRRAIKCGRVRADFIVRKRAEVVPVQERNTPSGILKLSTPEATAFDLVGYAKICGGLDNVATVLTGLAGKLNPVKLMQVAYISPITWAQRLGYILDLINESNVGQPLAEYIEKRSPVRSPLLTSAPIRGAKMNRRWRIFVNAELEPEF